MNRWFLFLALLALGAVLGCGSQPPGKPASKARQMKIVYTPELFNRYEQFTRPEDANQDLIVAGYLTKVGKDDLGTYVSLYVDDHHKEGIRCYFTPADAKALDELRSDQALVLKGKSKGKKILQVTLENCRVVDRLNGADDYQKKYGERLEK